MNGADVGVLVLLNTKYLKTATEFGGTLNVIGNAGDPAWRMNILRKHTRELDCQRLGFATSGSCQENTVAL
jgi:hypothetical protein